MDENIISEKFGVVFTKFPGSDYFLDFWIYFSIERGVEYVHGLMDRVHDVQVYENFIKPGPLKPRSTAQI
jgi:hypothetical protein